MVVRWGELCPFDCLSYWEETKLIHVAGSSQGLVKLAKTKLIVSRVVMLIHLPLSCAITCISLELPSRAFPTSLLGVISNHLK